MQSLNEPITKERIKAEIFTVRGIRVMLDSNIAVCFGVDTGALNRAMKRNIKRFPDTFCFQLTTEELENLKCQTGISSQFESYGGRRTLPYVYSEQGVAMLTSTLHTEQAIVASIQIIEAFVEMSHFLRQNEQLLPYQEIRRLNVRQEHLELAVKKLQETTFSKDELSELMALFEQDLHNKEILIMDGEPFKADLAYQKIYRRAKRKMIVIDDYINTKTLQHLAHAKPAVKVTIISDNKGGKPLRFREYQDFLTEYPGRVVTLTRSMNKAHDRYIILDHNTKDMKVYHCGASSKDAGRRITTITQLKDVDAYKEMIKDLLTNPPLVLK